MRNLVVLDLGFGNADPATDFHKGHRLPAEKSANRIDRYAEPPGGLGQRQGALEFQSPTGRRGFHGHRHTFPKSIERRRILPLFRGRRHGGRFLMEPGFRASFAPDGKPYRTRASLRR